MSGLATVGSDDSGDGRPVPPFASLPYAATQAAPSRRQVYLRGGRYRQASRASGDIVVSSLLTAHVAIARLPGELVTLTWQGMAPTLSVLKGSVGVTFRGLEMDGEADVNEHWRVLATSWWHRAQYTMAVSGGDVAFHVEGQHVIIDECVIHDTNQKEVNILVRRYMTVRDNVGNLIFNIEQRIYLIVASKGWATASNPPWGHR